MKISYLVTASKKKKDLGVVGRARVVAQTAGQIQRDLAILEQN